MATSSTTTDLEGAATPGSSRYSGGVPDEALAGRTVRLSASDSLRVYNFRLPSG